ncbi:ABC transporter permease subunit [Desulfobulbus alkaliphilus]|uniref:ABC transporter permease subunit n=1 Tax=Desulfobulbus alkaliphilus TaxID=869814 RepID=UPI0019633080|nr:ABC transporter permease subunit [Desulfobulbus alkaliphilus]MBM9535590.1 ABC transporter permease subunit [Desulfobulbus alkaliphilus]
MKDNILFRKLLISGTLIWVGLLAVVPYLILLRTSFLERGGEILQAAGWSLANYTRLFSPAVFSMAVDSALLAAGTALLCLLVGYPFAYILVRSGEKAQPLLLLLVMIPFWTNSLIRTYALVIMLKADGIINSLLLRLGLIDQPLQLMYTSVAVFIGLVYTLLPFMILPLFAAFKAMDLQLIEAGRDLGAGPLQTLLRIIVPLTMPGIIAGTMLVFLPALGMFYIADILGGARSMLLGNYIRDQFLVFRDLPMGAAASVAMTVAMGILLLLYYLASRRSGGGHLK